MVTTGADVQSSSQTVITNKPTPSILQVSFSFPHFNKFAGHTPNFRSTILEMVVAPTGTQ